MESKFKLGYTEEDVIKERVDHLIEERVPWLLVGLLGGILATLVVSKFEAVFAADFRLAFFIPIIVYLSGAVGVQTETIYVRELVERKIIFFQYILKESIIGISLGAVSGILLGIFALYWLGSYEIALTVGVSMFINLSLAPIMALLVSRTLYKRHSDPALGAGPVATVITDLISLLIFFSVANVFIF